MFSSSSSVTCTKILSGVYLIEICTICWWLGWFVVRATHKKRLEGDLYTDGAGLGMEWKTTRHRERTLGDTQVPKYNLQIRSCSYAQPPREPASHQTFHFYCSQTNAWPAPSSTPMQATTMWPHLELLDVMRWSRWKTVMKWRWVGNRGWFCVERKGGWYYDCPGLSIILIGS